jgi:glycosyltransferase involved in cell wall biosynthesis
VDVNHIYHAELYPFPLLRFLRKPIIFSVVSGLGPERVLSSGPLSRLSAIVVPGRRDMGRLTRWGDDRGHLLPGGIDVSRFSVEPPPDRDRFVLLAGSAPWTREQFRTKGVDSLLEVARHTPWLRLVLLWRGWLLEELTQRIAERGLSARVEVVTEHVDVNEVLARVHAAVVLANEQRLVKAYPHSLLEALAAGRPVLVSDCIVMAEHVKEADCGRVVRGTDEHSLGDAIRRLRSRYASHQRQAQRVGKQDFSHERLIAAYGRLYDSVTSPREGGGRTVACPPASNGPSGPRPPRS